MPTYEYECQKCGHAFERFQSMKDSPVKTCPKCRGKVKRLIGRGGGILFKGSGFYQTDYRSENYKKGAQVESSAATAPAGATKGSGSEATSTGATAAPASTAKSSGSEATSTGNTKTTATTEKTK